MLNSEERKHRKTLIQDTRINLSAPVPERLDFARESQRRDYEEYLRSGRVTTAMLERLKKASSYADL